jgi:hypothetical protein
MTSFSAFELELVRLAESSGEIHSSPLEQIARAHMALGSLAHYTVNERKDDAKRMAGEAMRRLIIYAAIEDIDLTECLGMAYADTKKGKA